MIPTFWFNLKRVISYKVSNPSGYTWLLDFEGDKNWVWAYADGRLRGVEYGREESKDRREG